jgi:hypothetical protein
VGPFDYRLAAHWRRAPAVSELWSTVARIRQREGDREGAARARRNGAQSAHRLVRLRESASVFYRTTHLVLPSGPACGYAPLGSIGISDPKQAPNAAHMCGNCTRTHAWRDACQEDAVAAAS